MLRHLSLAILLTVLCHRSVAEVVTIMPVGDSITAGYNGPPTELRGSYRQELGTLLSGAGIEHDFVGEFERGPGDNEHQGVSGASIGRMTLDYGPAIETYQPDYALVLAGTNNHFDEPNDAYFAQQYRDLLNTIRDNSPETTIVISTVPKFGYDRVPETSYWTNDFVDFRNDETFPSMNRAIRQVASEFQDVTVVDYYATFDI